MNQRIGRNQEASHTSDKALCAFGLSHRIDSSRQYINLQTYIINDLIYYLQKNILNYDFIVTNIFS
jgi:hypothetical protein